MILRILDSLQFGPDEASTSATEGTELLVMLGDDLEEAYTLGVQGVGLTIE